MWQGNTYLQIRSNYRVYKLSTNKLIILIFKTVRKTCIARQMFKFINKYNILYSHQYGFRPNHDTSQPLIQFLDKIYEGMNKDNPEYTIAIFLDLKKRLIP